MFTIICLICLNTTLLYIWFKTDAFVEYCKVLQFKKPIFNFLKQNSIYNYPQYLFINVDSIAKNNPLKHFLIKLITCPVCLGFWTAFLICSLNSSLMLTFIVYIGTLLTYFALVKLSA